MNFLSS